MKSPWVAPVVTVLAVVAIVIACFGLAAIGERRSDADDSRSAAGSGYSVNTKIRLSVTNTTSTDVVVSSTVVDESGWNGTKPTDPGVFSGQTISAGSTKGADLVISALRSKTPFELDLKTSSGTEIGTINLDRDYLKPTCTEITQGSYKINDCSQVNTWWFADSRILGNSSACPSSNNTRDLGEFTDAGGMKQRVKIRLSCSSTTGETTVSISQSAVPAK